MLLTVIWDHVQVAHVRVCHSSESSRPLLIVTAVVRGIWEFISMMLCFMKVCVNICRVELRIFYTMRNQDNSWPRLFIFSVRSFSLSLCSRLSQHAADTLPLGLNSYRCSGEMTAHGLSLVA